VKSEKINRDLKIAITSGDQDGIGPEVTAKALYKIGPQKGVHFFLWRSPAFPKKYLALIDKKFRRKTFSSWAEALKASPSSRKELFDINSPAPPPKWVEIAAQAGCYKHLDALVTAPLSKTLIADSGFTEIGHTEILSRVSGEKDLFMGFLGAKFNVLLATGHIPLHRAPGALTCELLTKALRAGHLLATLTGTKKRVPRIAVVGMNPHAGENGLLGDEEREIFLPVIEKLKSEKISVDGPLVPDAAFLPHNWDKYSVFVTPYHDQGLIPFKVVHAHKGGCHITMGLPFVRTSVEHGTAKDIAGKDKADSSSMQDALLRAILLSRNSFKPNDF